MSTPLAVRTPDIGSGHGSERTRGDGFEKTRDSGAIETQSDLPPQPTQLLKRSRPHALAIG